MVEGSPRVNALPSSSSLTWLEMSNKSNPVSLLPHLVETQYLKIIIVKGSVPLCRIVLYSVNVVFFFDNPTDRDSKFWRAGKNCQWTWHHILKTKIFMFPFFFHSVFWWGWCICFPAAFIVYLPGKGPPNIWNCRILQWIKLWCWIKWFCWRCHSKGTVSAKHES